MIETLKKLEGKKFEIDLCRFYSAVYVIAENLKIEITSDRYIMLCTKARSKDDIVEVTSKTGGECESVSEHWSYIRNVPLRGFEFKLKNGDSLFVETNSGAQLEVKELE